MNLSLLTPKEFKSMLTYEAWMWLEGCHTKVRRGCLRVGAMSELFFFHKFAPTQLQFTPIQLESGCINRRLKRPKQAKIGLESCWNSWNRLWMRPKHPKSVLPQFYSEYLLFLLCFLFCFVFLVFLFLCFVNQGIVMCFLRIF